MEMSSFSLDQRHSVQEFIGALWEIRPPDIFSVPPLKVRMEAQLSPHNPFFQHGLAKAFLMRHQGRIVGRIIASIDHKLHQNAGQKIGHFGYFECIDNTAVASHLLEAGEAWLWEQGATAIHDPVNLNIMLGYRLQTLGFDTEPFLGEPRNPAYYARLLESCGYRIYSHWNSWDLSPKVISQLADHAQDAANSYLHQFVLKSFDWTQELPELNEFCPVALSTFSSNYGYSDISPDELSGYFKPMLQLLKSGLFTKAYDHTGKLIGYTFGYWDIAPAFQYANGDAAVLEKPEAHTQPRRFLIHTIAVEREHRKSGVAHGLFASIFNYTKSSGLAAIACMTTQGATIFDPFCKPTRTYCVFVKDRLHR